MKISTKGRYGLRAIVDLAANSEGSHLSLSQISRRQGISLHYLEQFFLQLKKAGLVQSIKGSTGGFFLCCDPEKVTIADILNILEGDYSFAEKRPNTKESSPYELYLEKYLWQVIDEDVNEYLGSTTLAELVEYYKKEKEMQ